MTEATETKKRALMELYIWKEINDGNAVIIGMPNTFKPEVYGPMTILLSMHIDPFCDIVGKEQYEIVKGLKRGERRRVTVSVAVEEG